MGRMAVLGAVLLLCGRASAGGGLSAQEGSKLVGRFTAAVTEINEAHCKKPGDTQEAELAKRLTAKGVGAAVFDRGWYKFHGRIKALADGAREGGLDF